MCNFQRVKRNGFAFFKAVPVETPTIRLAQELGKIVQLSKLSPDSGISAVHSLKPHPVTEVNGNHYSGSYGLNEFPLHSDLAHWAIPPQFLLLRCIVGSSDVLTHILSWSHVEDFIQAETLQRAVFAGRTRRYGQSGLVRALAFAEQRRVHRWDALFLKPLNQPARTLGSVMSETNWAEMETKILLQQPGDAILIDNWQMLHGRSQVPDSSRSRHIERVYLSELFQ